jgi:hypothetical protein
MQLTPEQVKGRINKRRIVQVAYIKKKASVKYPVPFLYFGLIVKKDKFISVFLLNYNKSGV